MCKIAFIMGKSATGKDHIYKALVEDNELNLKTVVMYTTRPMRAAETEGVEYHFVDDEYAQKLAETNKIIELRAYNTVCGVWKYFTADDGQIDLEKGKYIVIGTLEAYEKYCDYFGKEMILPIYIETDDGIRLERALTREKKQEVPKYAEMCRRFLADCEDFSEEKLRNHGIDKVYYNNGEIIDCINEIKADILHYVIED